MGSCVNKKVENRENFARLCDVSIIGCIMVPKVLDTNLWTPGILLYMEKGLCRCDKVKDLEMGKLSW